jgi:transposase
LGKRLRRIRISTRSLRWRRCTEKRPASRGCQIAKFAHHPFGASFTAWVEQQLCPMLGPGDIVILDNLSSHKKPAVRHAIRASGAPLMFLPPYSPDLNPIEQVFANRKHLLCKAAERSKDAHDNASERSSITFRRTNAPIICRAQVMVQPDAIPL